MSPLPVSYSSLDASAASSSSSSPEPEVSVSTVAATAVATGLLMFKLEGYSRLKARHGKDGSYIESNKFKVGGHSWSIRCYLNGLSKDDAGFVSLFLCLRSHAAERSVHAEYVFDLVPHRHHDTPPAPAGHQDQGTPSKTSHGGVGLFGGKHIGWGALRFIGVEELERSEFLKDDCFAVRCAVTVVRERTVKEKAVQPGDMARLGLGMLCKCDDELCKRRHARNTETLLERFANFCYSICRGGYIRIT